MSEQEAAHLDRRAYEAINAGDLAQASALFAELLAREPDEPNYHYMRGLAHKYLRDWSTSLAHNLRAQALFAEFDDASAWNAGIAATGLGDHEEAWRQWESCGIRPFQGDGPVASIRLNPWDGGETLFARRLDPVRARLINVPFPKSGYQFGDIVLNDGAATGRRAYGDGGVPVFNALQLLERSEFKTFGCVVTCPTPEDAEALELATAPGVGEVEDWTRSTVWYCLRCSYGAPHEHPDSSAESESESEADTEDQSVTTDGDFLTEEDAEPEWETERDFGIAAQHRKAVVKLLERWKSQDAGRRIESISYREHLLSEPVGNSVWWRFDEPDDAEEQADADADSTINS